VNGANAAVAVGPNNIHRNQTAIGIFRSLLFIFCESNIISKLPSDKKNASEQPAQPADTMSDFAYAAGIVLGLSYPILALSTGARAIYQLLFKTGVTYYLPPTLSAIAATSYLFATIGFAVRRKWAWRLSVGLLGFETLLTFIVGTLSFVYPDLIGRTVWRHFGIDYGFFPLFQPLIGLVWLFSPGTLKAYGLRASQRVSESASE
jgi:hypothetical protein